MAKIQSQTSGSQDILLILSYCHHSVMNSDRFYFEVFSIIVQLLKLNTSSRCFKLKACQVKGEFMPIASAFNGEICAGSVQFNWG